MMRFLFKNKFISINLFILIAVMLLCFFPFIVTPNSPLEQHPWISFLGPGSSAPPAYSTQQIKVDESLVIPYDALKAKALEWKIEKRKSYDVRFVLRRQKISQFIKISGAEPLQELNCEGGSVVYEVLENGTMSKVSISGHLKVGEKPPLYFIEQKRRVFVLRVFEKEILKSVLKASIENSNVKTLKLNDEKISSVTVRAEDIISVKIDGKLVYQNYLFGTDSLGRCLLSRILHGGRISLSIGLAATLVSVAIGVLVGSIAGYLGGKVDIWIMGAIDILYAIPFIFLVILFMVYFGNSIYILFMALGCVQWLTMARIVRGHVMSLKSMNYIDAARLNGCGTLKIIFNHLIPNSTGPIIIYATLTVPAVILEESFLSFIGLGVQFEGQSLDSWGALVNQGISVLGSNGERSWVLIFPAIIMGLTLLCLNNLGDGLRDAYAFESKD